MNIAASDAVRLMQSPEDRDAERVERAVEIAKQLLVEADELSVEMTRSQKRSLSRAELLVRSEQARRLVSALTDEVTRIADHGAAAARFARVVDDIGVASTFSLRDRVLLRAGALLAPRMPNVVMPLVVKNLRTESGGLIVSKKRLGAHLATMTAGLKANVNVLGESILGPHEAHARFDRVLASMQRPDVNYVSVKLSAIIDGISALAFDDTVRRASLRIRELYRASIAHRCFVNLDMEEYRDLDLTIAVFTSVLDEPEFVGLEAGIVLQAYLPDAAAAAADLCAWARRRMSAGGAPIKIRIVKGANLAMEQVEAELRGWDQAPFSSKVESDANYKRALDIVLTKQNEGAVRVGLASHNVFDIAWALSDPSVSAAVQNAQLSFEMLQGMAPALTEALRRRVGAVVLYTPVVDGDDFTSAIAYLVRRLDENTSPENALSAMFNMSNVDVFAKHESVFRRSVSLRHSVSSSPRRRQDRRVPELPIGLDVDFDNESDTDFSLDANRKWVENLLATAPMASVAAIADSTDTVDAAVRLARLAQPLWSATPQRERAEMVNRVGDVIAAARGEIAVAMIHEGNKTLAEADPEISEAVDFARYYARLGLELDPHLSEPLGTIVVTPPWNFPYAIAMGGVLAALAAGNCVILKPAPQVRAIQQLVAQHCWDAGVPRDVLQFLPIPDGEAGRHLISHDDVDGVILTGSYATAQMFLEWRPPLALFAETSGKNSMVITPSADVDLAIKDLVKSAFGHAGQKCSAASIAIVDAALYNDGSFFERLADGVASLKVGEATALATDVAPLVDPPSADLLRALTVLDPGEAWLVEPRVVDASRHLWSPGVRIGVKPDSWFARTECFGPVLGVVRSNGLDDAIAIQNSGDFGLTAGLHSLDPGEIETWCDQVKAGNAYVNRTITGAIVRRQPFGGWKRSAVGATAKAGGPNYVAMLRRPTRCSDQDVSTVARSYARWWTENGEVEVDPTGLRAESNTYRRRRFQDDVVIRVGVGADEFSVQLTREAAHVAGVAVRWSHGSETSEERWLEELRLCRPGTRLRAIGAVSDEALRIAHRRDIVVDLRPPFSDPSIELPRWRLEQSLSITRHRHGHIAQANR